MDRWQQMVSEGDALERIRGQQMMDLTAEGKIVKQIPELTTMVLESMTVNEETVRIKFSKLKKKAQTVRRTSAFNAGTKYATVIVRVR